MRRFKRLTEVSSRQRLRARPEAILGQREALATPRNPRTLREVPEIATYSDSLYPLRPILD